MTDNKIRSIVAKEGGCEVREEQADGTLGAARFIPSAMARQAVRANRPALSDPNPKQQQSCYDFALPATLTPTKKTHYSLTINKFVVWEGDVSPGDGELRVFVQNNLLRVMLRRTIVYTAVFLPGMTASVTDCVFKGYALNGLEEDGAPLEVQP